MAKITPRRIERIKRLAGTLSSRQIARRVGCSQAVVLAIKNGTYDRLSSRILDPELEAGERNRLYVCRSCRAINRIWPCRKCRLEGNIDEGGQMEFCPQCAKTVATRENTAQLRCGEAGHFIRPLTTAERAERKRHARLIAEQAAGNGQGRKGLEIV